MTNHSTVRMLTPSQDRKWNKKRFKTQKSHFIADIQITTLRMFWKQQQQQQNKTNNISRKNPSFDAIMPLTNTREIVSFRSSWWEKETWNEKGKISVYTGNVRQQQTNAAWSDIYWHICGRWRRATPEFVRRIKNRAFPDAARAMKHALAFFLTARIFQSCRVTN